MSNMKCPVCKTGTVEQGKHDKEYFCDNEFCPSYDETDSKTYNILIRTRKALDVAVDALKSIDWCGQDYANAQGALDEIEQITALEQKDVK